MSRRSALDRLASSLSGSAGRWWPARRRIAAIAVATATMTATASIAIGGSGPALPEMAWVLVAVIALRHPAAVAALVFVGLFMIGGLLAALEGGARLALAPLMAGVLLTVELLAIAGRLDNPVERDPGADPFRAVITAGIGAAVFALILLVGELAGPSGPLAFAVASAACLALGLAMASAAADRGS